MQVLANIAVVIILQYEVHWINMLYTLNLHNVSIQLYLNIAGKAFNFSSHCGCLKFLQFYIITIFIKQRNMLSIKSKKNVFIWTIMFEYIIYLINIILLYIYILTYWFINLFKKLRSEVTDLINNTPYF